MPVQQEHGSLEFTEFRRLIDQLHDEIVIYDRQYRIVYINQACLRHYGYTQAEMIGKHFQHFAKEQGCWNNSVLPSVYRLKQPLSTVQKTYLGNDILTIAKPMLNANGEVEYVLMSVRDLDNVQSIQRLQDVLNHIEHPPAHFLEGLIYRSDAMTKVLSLAQHVSELTSPCLLLGETGCGKSLLAKYIHLNSSRSEQPFVIVNCAGIPQDLFESELFGHKRGAFSGALQDKLGLLAEAEGGTLFLDEISELPLAMQAKLLHAVQEREYRPLGSTKTRQANVKLLAASNRDLLSMVQSGAFREDLYYRLSVFEIHIPALRYRQADLLPLISYFLNHFNQQYQHHRQLSDEALHVLLRYAWPGNVRQLSHLLERLVVTAADNLIQISDLPATLYEAQQHLQPASLVDGEGLQSALDALERQLLQATLANHPSTRQLAKALKISQSKAVRLLRKHQLSQG